MAMHVHLHGGLSPARFLADVAGDRPKGAATVFCTGGECASALAFCMQESTRVTYKRIGRHHRQVSHTATSFLLPSSRSTTRVSTRRWRRTPNTSYV